MHRSTALQNKSTKTHDVRHSPRRARLRLTSRARCVSLGVDHETDDVWRARYCRIDTGVRRYASRRYGNDVPPSAPPATVPSPTARSSNYTQQTDASVHPHCHDAIVRCVLRFCTRSSQHSSVTRSVQLNIAVLDPFTCWKRNRNGARNSLHSRGLDLFHPFFSWFAIFLWSLTERGEMESAVNFTIGRSYFSICLITNKEKHENMLLDWSSARNLANDTLARSPLHHRSRGKLLWFYRWCSGESSRQ